MTVPNRIALEDRQLIDTNLGRKLSELTRPLSLVVVVYCSIIRSVFGKFSFRLRQSNLNLVKHLYQSELMDP